MIPKIIHQTWKSIGEMSPEHRHYRRTCQVKNPWWEGWEHKFYTDADCRAVIEEERPDLLKIYDGYPKNIQRYDMWRAVVVQAHGGFYADIDMLFEKSLTELCSSSCVIPHEFRTTIGNYMFAAEPDHPFINNIIDEMAVRSQMPIKLETDVYKTTGPILWTEVYRSFPDKELIRVLPGAYHASAQQGFGDWAKHVCSGTWKHNIRISQKAWWNDKKYRG